MVLDLKCSATLGQIFTIAKKSLPREVLAKIALWKVALTRTRQLQRFWKVHGTICDQTIISHYSDCFGISRRTADKELLQPLSFIKAVCAR
jgi:hypothetical protein